MQKQDETQELTPAQAVLACFAQEIEKVKKGLTQAKRRHKKAPTAETAQEVQNIEYCLKRLRIIYQTATKLA